MSLAKEAHNYFYAGDRERGQSYFAAGNIRSMEFENDKVMSVVENDSGGEYYVEFRTKSVHSATCDCPRFSDGFYCKHIWASLLFFDAEHRVKLPQPYITTKATKKKSAKKLARKRSPKVKWQSALQEITSYSSVTAAHDLHDSEYAIWYVITLNRNIDNTTPLIEFYRSNQGEGDIRSLALHRSTSHTLSSVADANLVDLISLWRESNLGRNNHAYIPITEWRIPYLGIPSLLAAFGKTDRLFWRLDKRVPVEESQKLTVNADQTWQFGIEVVTDRKDKSWKFTGVLRCNNEERPLDSTVAVFSAGVVMFPEEIAKFDNNGLANWLNLLQQGSIRIPFRDREKFLSMAADTGLLDQIKIPESLAVEAPTPAPGPLLRILQRNDEFGGQRNVDAEVWFHYGDEEIRLSDKRARIPIGKTILKRNIIAEKALLAKLPSRIFPAEVNEWKPQPPDVQFPRKDLISIVSELFETEWRVELEGRLVQSSGEFNIEVTSGIDWFDLNVKCEFQNTATQLPKILAAARDGKRFVELDDGSMGMVPEEWVKKFGDLLDLGTVEGDAIRFGKTQALLLDSMLAAQKQKTIADRPFKTFCRKLRSFAGIKPKEAPRTFKGELRDYQKSGLGWLHFLREFGIGGCLADDMGLGKTIQVLALLESRRKRRVKEGETRRPTLVVVPKSLVFNWIEEGSKFTPNLRIGNYTGGARAEVLARIDDYDVLVTTYGSMRLDISKLSDIKFDYVILDESQAIKNSNAQVAKAARLLQSDHRLAMTGTPIENNLGELWSLFEFLNPGMLGRSSAFKRIARSAGGIQDERRKRQLETLSTAIRPYMLRRKKSEVLKDLPDKTEQTLFCDLPKAQRKTYDQIRDYYRAKLLKTAGMDCSKIQVLEALLRLRQAACHPGLIDKKHKKVGSAKLDILQTQLEEVISEGHKVLVFSQFTSLLALVREQLDDAEIEYEYLDGRTRKRQTKVERFQTDENCSVFLISLKAGGSGLNLTAADYVFILDPWWNPAVEAQAVDRAHRIGQAKHVFAYRMIARDTVEEHIMKLQDNKRELADAIISQNSNVIADLSAEDLQLLLS